MKKFLFITLLSIITLACGSQKVYNSALKQVELGMTKQQVVALMGNDYINSTGPTMIDGKQYESLEYRDRYKNHFIFEFSDNSLYKWYKQTE